MGSESQELYEKALMQTQVCIRAFYVPGGIRTHGLSLRRRTLYPAELRRHAPNILNGFGANVNIFEGELALVCFIFY